jgi:hypothetical protein
MSRFSSACRWPNEPAPAEPGEDEQFEAFMRRYFPGSTGSG